MIESYAGAKRSSPFLLLSFFPFHLLIFLKVKENNDVFLLCVY